MGVLQSDLNKMQEVIDKLCNKVRNDYQDFDACNICKLDSMCEELDGDFRTNVDYCVKAYRIALEELGLTDEPVYDNVKHPKHYNQGKYECVKVMLDVFGKEFTIAFSLENAFKYLYRCKHKGKMVEDLQKADYYINLALELMKDEQQ